MLGKFGGFFFRHVRHVCNCIRIISKAWDVCGSSRHIRAAIEAVRLVYVPSGTCSTHLFCNVIMAVSAIFDTLGAFVCALDTSAWPWTCPRSCQSYRPRLLAFWCFPMNTRTLIFFHLSKSIAVITDNELFRLIRRLDIYVPARSHNPSRHLSNLTVHNSLRVSQPTFECQLLV